MKALLTVVFLLAAAANAEVFHFVGPHGHGSSLYDVYGGVTVGLEELTGEKAALEYNGTLAIGQVREGEFVAKFTHFTLGKYGRVNKNLFEEALSNFKPEEQRHVKVLAEQGAYLQEMQKPVKFYMNDGKVVRMEASSSHKQWSLNVFRGVLTLLQNQVRRPANLAVPFIEHKYEDGVTGNCKVQYEVLSQPKDETVSDVFNLTKTKNYKDCLGRPVYLHLKDIHRGCAGVCDNHCPENFLDRYEEENTDFEMKPTPGCPVNQQYKDSLVTVHTVTKYNVSEGLLDEARSESVDVYRLFGAKVQAFTRLQLRLHSMNGPRVEPPTSVIIYETLQHRLPKEEQDELDIPVYALMRDNAKSRVYPQYFQKHFETVIRELHRLQETQEQSQKEEQGFHTPAYLIELVQAMSGMTEEEIRKTVPRVVLQPQPKRLTVKEQLRRQVWIELLGKAGSKSAVKIAVEYIKSRILTPTEVRRLLQDIAGFQSYPDTAMIELVLGLCTKEESLTAAGKATACVAAGKIISKACNSKVYQKSQKIEQPRQPSDNKYRSGQYPTTYTPGHELHLETEEHETTMGHLAIPPKVRCTSTQLQQYVQRLAQALREATEFKHVVAYINGLAKVEKPEVLPELLGYVNGTAYNLEHVSGPDEEPKEAVEFLRRVAILSLRNIAAKYPKEVNPIVRVVFENVTEKVQTRVVAFDVWINTQPAQWEIEKIMQIANKDPSLELTHYVYTALRTARDAQEPCYQLLAQRIRAAWTQIRPVKFDMAYSHLSSKHYYNAAEDIGVRGIWKMIASNVTAIPSFTQGRLEHVYGPYVQTLFGAKLLVKGGDQIWNELVGMDGLLERIANAFEGQIHKSDEKQEAFKLLKDIAEGMDLKVSHDKTPKAVLFWRLFSGEAVIPMDSEYLKELKDELLQSVTKFGKEGLSGHFIRVFFPTKAFHIEPTPIGLPVVHSTVHPLVVSVRYRNVKVRFANQKGRIVPKSLEVTGTVQPTLLSLRQSRVFIADKKGQASPTVKVSDVKEFNLQVALKISYAQPERRFFFNVKPRFERIFHSGRCAEIGLFANAIIGEESQSTAVDYAKCVRPTSQSIGYHHQIGGPQTGMIIRLVGKSDQVWPDLSIFGSTDDLRRAPIAVLNNLVFGMKHHAMSVYLEADQQQPVTEWTVIVDKDYNIDDLVSMPIREQIKKIQKISVQYKPRRGEQLKPEFEQMIHRMDQLLEKTVNEIEETTIEKQTLLKIQGRFQDQPRHTLRVAVKEVFNFEKTEQQYAIVAEHQESRKSVELFANVSYSVVGSPFRYDATQLAEDARMNGTAFVKFVGAQTHVYSTMFEAVKSENQLKKTNLGWFEVRCLAEQKAGKTMTEACRKAIVKDNYLDLMRITLHAPQGIHPAMKDFTNKILDLVKYKFYPHMRTELIGRVQRNQQQKYPHEENEVRITTNAIRDSPWAFLYDIRLEMPRENIILSKIRLPGLRPVHTQLTLKQQLEKTIYRGVKYSGCYLGENIVRTYDNVTFSLDVKPGCEYVLSRDQSPTSSPKFTVTFQVVSPQTLSKKVRVQLHDTVVEFEPFTASARAIKIVVNGTQHTVAFEKLIVFEYAAGKRVFISAYQTGHSHHPPVVKLKTDTSDLVVMFNGYAAQTLVSDSYKGKVNGVCGNNDNESNHEFIGPHGNEYKHANEFIASYGIGKTCQVPVENTWEQLMEKFNTAMHVLRTKQIARKEQGGHHQGEDTVDFWDDRQEDQQVAIAAPMEHTTQTQWSTVAQPHGGFHHLDGHELEQKNRQTLKTVVSVEKGFVCFSARPVPTCKPGYHKEGVLRTESVESVCVPRHLEVALQAMRDIRQGKIVDVSTLEPHQTKRPVTMFNVPKCQRYD
nr:vitellogenin 1-like protein [Dermanyssus gallinae]